VLSLAGLFGQILYPFLGWAAPVCGAIGLVLAQRTARDVWRAGLKRQRDLFAVENPDVEVIPLHPADER
jgi:hypothetical protein